MKTRLTLLLSLICFLSLGQNQTPFPDTLASWVFQSWQYADPADPNSQTTYSTAVMHARDTVHQNGYVYTRLFADYDSYIYTPENCTYAGSLVGYHRIDGDKVYYIKEPTATSSDWAFFVGADYNPAFYSEEVFGTSNEILLYDFGLTVGDSFAISQHDIVIVETIDSVLIYNQYYKRFNFDVSLSMAGSIPMEYHWIEGIGSSFGYFPFADCFESGGQGLCFHEYFYSGNNTYPDSTNSYEYEDGFCWVLQAGQDELTKQMFKVSPNPTNGIIQLEFTEEDNIIEICNSSGKLLDKFNTAGNSLIYDMSRYNSGVYFIKVNNQVARISKN